MLGGVNICGYHGSYSHVSVPVIEERKVTLCRFPNRFPAWDYIQALSLQVLAADTITMYCFHTPLLSAR